jgi:hypothetical protein
MRSIENVENTQARPPTALTSGPPDDADAEAPEWTVRCPIFDVLVPIQTCSGCHCCVGVSVDPDGQGVYVRCLATAGDPD